MSKYEQKDNSGALFKNDKKESEKQPDYRGECVVNGKELAVSAWIKTSAKGTKYMSLSFSEPYKKAVKVAGDDDSRSRNRWAEESPRANVSSSPYDDDQDIPFN